MKASILNSTLLFLIKEKGGVIEEICLALKKRGFGQNKWNGVGGKMNETDKTIEDTALREAQEEISVVVKNPKKIAEIEFVFPHQSEWNQIVHVYTAKNWSGDPIESEEMKPKWIKVNEIPYAQMWADDIFWFPNFLKKKAFRARFVFNSDNEIVESWIKQVERI